MGSKNIEYLLLGGAFYTILLIGCIFIMAFVIRTTSRHNTEVSEKMEEIKGMIDADNEVKKTLIEQIRLLIQTLKKE